MELPHIGEHCNEPSCKMLDFLPMKCDACKLIFCKDHIHYATHSCTESYKKDYQVPTCPLCNSPVPVRRGEVPDVAVGAHIDNDCRSDQARQKREKKNRCGVKKCKQIELVPIKCSSCGQNFCLRHRHTADHDCPALKNSTVPGSTAPAPRQEMSAAGAAALRRQQQPPSSTSRPRPSRPSQPSAPSGSRGPLGQPQTGQVPTYSAGALQGGMSEEEAMQLALALSLADSNPNLSETMVPEQNRQQRRQAGTQGSQKPKESCDIC